MVVLHTANFRAASRCETCCTIVAAAPKGMLHTATLTRSSCSLQRFEFQRLTRKRTRVLKPKQRGIFHAATFTERLLQQAEPDPFFPVHLFHNAKKSGIVFDIVALFLYLLGMYLQSDVVFLKK